MVNNKIAQRAVAAGLSGLMAFGAAAPAALAFTPQDFNWYNVDSNDDGVYWKRLSGDDRYGTMKEIVKAYNEYEREAGINIYGIKKESDYNYHGTAVIASGDNFPDALAANGLAGYLTNMSLTTSAGNNGSVPVILTKSGKLSNEAKDLLKYMQVQEAIVMGGTAAISQDVEDAIAKMGIRVSRIAGADRQETSLKALQAINGNWKGRKGTWDLIIATGDNYADALSISPYAYRMGTPIVLTKKDGTLTDAQVEAIRSNDDIREILIVGGTAAVSDQVMGQIGTINKNKHGVQYNRIAGVDRYDTSAKIAQFEVEAWTSLWNGIAGFTFNHAIVATGENFPDALAGGQLAGGIGDLLDPINVKNFSGYNQWTPSPLLLVKDGDMRAAYMIGQGIAMDGVTSNTATYASWASWCNTVQGWYGNNTKEYKELYGDSAFNSAFNKWYKSASPLYISDKAIESVVDFTGTDPEAYAKTEEKLTYKTEGGRVTAFSVTVNGQTYDLTNRTNTYATTGAAVAATSEGFRFITGTTVEYWYTDTITGVKYLRVNAAPLDVMGNIMPWNVPGAELANNGSYTHDVVFYDGDADPTLAGPFTAGAWATEVIGMVDWDTDFYGIILGGTAAVSNKVRDDLDDIVATTAGDDNVFTSATGAPDTIVKFSETWGVNVNYSRLIPVATNVNKRTNLGRRGDVYRVASTGAYVVIEFNKADGALIDWEYYKTGKVDPTYIADWNA